MMYFDGITDFNAAKQRYRILAKQLYPDKGGTATAFQKMQEEYKILLLRLQHQSVPTVHHPSPENELLNELDKLAQVLIKKQVPQNFIKQKIQTSNSTLKRNLFSDIINFLDNL